jgi:hypothetical protein
MYLLLVSSTQHAVSRVRCFMYLWLCVFEHIVLLKQPPKPPRKKITMSVISTEPDSDLHSLPGFGGVSGGRRALAIGEGHSTPLTSVTESPATSPTDLVQPPAHHHQPLSDSTSPTHLATSTQDRNNNGNNICDFSVELVLKE